MNYLQPLLQIACIIQLSQAKVNMLMACISTQSLSSWRDDMIRVTPKPCILLN